MLVHAERTERRRHDERMDRPRAKRLHVAPGSVRTARLLRDRFAEVAAAALVTVADGLLPAADDVGDILGRKPRARQQLLERERAGRLAREVLEEDRGRQALVEVVRGEHRARDAIAPEERQ